MRIIRKLVRNFIKLVLIFVVFVVFVASIFYINTTIYHFKVASPFSGTHIFNPYQNLPNQSYKANFHAHTIAWKEVTNGYNTEEDMFREYSERGYDIVGISNYHNISTYAKNKTDLFVPVYEHGYNIFKSHYLSIGADQVSFFDYPLYQFTSHKQKIIENLKDNGAIVAMAHPKFAGGRSFSDMQHLVHYDFTEVLNHYRISDEHWDKALSAGKLTWVMGNDDTHDLKNEPSFMIWNVIHSDFRNADSILSAMKSGKNYGVHSLNGKLDNSLVSCQMTDSNSFLIQLDTIANSVEVIGQNGKLLKNRTTTDNIEYSFRPEDTYVRIVVKNTNSTLYLNPLVRFDGNKIPLNSKIKPSENSILTWLSRILFAAFSLSLLFLIRKIIRYK